MAFMSSIQDIFTAITRIIEVFSSVVIKEHVTVNRRIIEIKHRTVEHIHKGTAGRVGSCHADAQTLILPPAGTVMEEIFSVMAYYFRRPEIGCAPGVFPALIDITNVGPVDKIW